MQQLPLNNSGDTNTLLNIHTMLARQDQTLNNMNQDMREIRDDIKGIRTEMKEYMPKSEAKIQFDAILAVQASMQIQMAEIQQWRMTSSLATVREINAVQQSSKQEVNEVKGQSWTRIISAQGAIILFGAGFVLWIIEQFLINAHVFGR